MSKGLKTGGRSKGRPNNRTLKREEAAAKTVALIGDLIPDAFAGRESERHGLLFGK